MMRVDSDRCVFAPRLFVAIGGAGCELMLVFRALVFALLGFLPECFRFLAFDFATDPPRAPGHMYPGWLPEEAWAEAALRPSELCTITLGDSAELGRQMLESEPSVAFLKELAPAELVAAPRGNEASQIPALTRLALALCADNPDLTGGVRWPDRIAEALSSLGPAGEALHAFTGLRGLACASSETTVVFLVGANGGTGSGGLIPAAIVTRWLGRRSGTQLKTHAVVLCGPYRPEDGQEQAKAALGHALDLEMDYAVATPEATFTFPLGPDVEAWTRGRLFDAVYREEAVGRLSGTGYYRLLAAAAETLVYRYVSKAGAEMQKSRNNVITKPVLRAIGGGVR